MPQPSFRSFVGVAKDSINTTLSASAAAAATTITVASAAGITTSHTVFIVDGANSESRAVTNVASNTLTVAALTNAHSANTYVYAQTTASVGPTDYIPVTHLEFKDTINQLVDKGLRGSAVEEYNRVQGVRHSEISLGGDLFADTIGYLLGGLFGATDFTGGTPNTHAFSVKNTSDTQPTPFVVYNFDVTDTRAYPGTKFEELQFKIDPAGLVTWTAKGKGWMSGAVANPTSSFSTVTPSPSWQVQATLAGTAVLTVLSADITLKRPAAVISTLQAIQDPYKVFLGPCSVEGSMVVVMEDNTELNRYLNGTQPSLDLTLTNGTGSTQVQFSIHATKANYNMANPVQVGKPYIELPISFTLEANTTDATTAGTGSSPCKVTIKNSKATGSYQ